MRATAPRVLSAVRKRPAGGTHLAVNGTLTDKTVLVIGRGSGIARAVTEAARAAGAKVIVAGRDQETLAGAYDDPGISTETVDLTDDASIEALAGRLNGIDHVVSTASARARGTLAELDREKVRLSFDTKVIGPLMLAKHLGPRLRPGGSFVIFSGAAAFNIQVGTLAVAITNGAADTLTRSLAVELAPIRVNAISPGIIDTGAWDGLGEEGKARLYAHATDTFPARRVGEAADIADAVLFCMTNTYLTGMTLKVDGGEALV
jgi:NAD(P)-dependent dehydrogenase (short-subunit alcohol dehydrogenase family)